VPDVLAVEVDAEAAADVEVVDVVVVVDDDDDDDDEDGAVELLVVDLSSNSFFSQLFHLLLQLFFA